MEITKNAVKKSVKHTPLMEETYIGKVFLAEEDIEEERRMFYVGMTRAKQYLYLYLVKERYNKEMFMSRFIEEILKE